MITTLRSHEISSPGEMADSMTQSMASVSSLARDFSWEQLHTDTEREVMMMLMMIYMMIVVIMTMAMSSLTRDFSWVQLGANVKGLTSTLKVTMTEDSIGSPADLSRDDSSDMGGSDSLRRRWIFISFVFV